MTDEARWPNGFMNISDCTFKWVFENKKEFVNFTLEKMDSPTGLFREWKLYCLKQNRDGVSQKTTKEIRENNTPEEKNPNTE